MRVSGGFFKFLRFQANLVFGCVHSSLYEGLSVCPLVRSSVKRFCLPRNSIENGIEIKVELKIINCPLNNKICYIIIRIFFLKRLSLPLDTSLFKQTFFLQWVTTNAKRLKKSYRAKSDFWKVCWSSLSTAS